jgi:hypothetical protein
MQPILEFASHLGNALHRGLSVNELRELRKVVNYTRNSDRHCSIMKKKLVRT